jgi:copper ion binding protein
MTTRSRQIVYAVPTVMCEHCRAAIERAVGPLAGVTSVSVDLEGKKVEVRLASDGASLEDVQRAIEEEGYEVAGTDVSDG